MERLKIAVVGASGFIGSNLVSYLRRKGHKAYPIVKKESDIWRLRHTGNAKNIVYADIGDRNSIFKAITKLEPEIVINTAAYGLSSVQTDRKKMYDVNLAGTINLLDACVEEGVKLFVNTGTVSEYGKKPRAISEDDKLEPETDYGLSKALATDYCVFRRGSQTKTVTLRLFTPYGYYESSSRLIPYLLISCLKNRQASLSNPANYRDFVFIDDVMRAYMLTIRKYTKIESGSIFNIGYGRQHSVKEVVETVQKVTGRHLDIKWGVSPPRPGDNNKMWQANISRAKRVLGWKPKTDLADGITHFNKWIKENIKLYEGVRI